MAEQLVTYNDERTPDYQYQDLLKRILNEGDHAQSGMDDGSTEILGHQMVFELENGFPMITERDITRGSTPQIIAGYESNPARRPLAGPAKQAIGEIIGFMNGAHTQEELEAFGTPGFWKPWTENTPKNIAKAAKRGIEVGDLGPGSYGPAFHDFPTGDGGHFDQYGQMIAQMKDRPELRTHVITPFIPDLISRAPGNVQKTLIVPCHGLQHYNINVAEREISLVHWQRAADVPIGLPYNMMHYATTLMMVGQATGLKPKNLVFQISNGHIYDQHLEVAEELANREPFPFPKVEIDPTIKDIEKFRVGDFAGSEYFAHPPMAMPGPSV